MYAIFAMRKMSLTTRINQIQTRLMQLSQKLSDIALFGANMQDGILSPEEAMYSPASMFGHQLQCSNNIFMQAMPMAQMHMSMYMQQQAMYGAQGLANPYQQNPALVFRSILQQAMEFAARGMQKRIAAEENKIQMEKTRLETQLKAAMHELEQCEKAEEEGIKRSTPKYV